MESATNMADLIYKAALWEGVNVAVVTEPAAGPAVVVVAAIRAALCEQVEQLSALSPYDHVDVLAALRETHKPMEVVPEPERSIRSLRDVARPLARPTDDDGGAA